jgi:hypothetical protein
VKETMNKRKQIPSEVWYIVAYYTRTSDLPKILNLNKSIQSTVVQYFSERNNFMPVLKNLLTREHSFTKKIVYEDQYRTLEIFLKLFSKYDHPYPFVNPTNVFIYFVRSKVKDYPTMVELLLLDGRVDPSTENNSALRWASAQGHTSVVKMLLADTRCDATADNNYAIRWACAHGHADVVRELLLVPSVDPSADNNRAMRTACQAGHKEVVQLLLSDKRTNTNAKVIANEYKKSQPTKRVALLRKAFTATQLAFGLRSNSNINNL